MLKYKINIIIYTYILIPYKFILTLLYNFIIYIHIILKSFPPLNINKGHLINVF